ncbi:MULTISPECIES: hypothetical protein [unclassified Burkholderia]|uniref:hypothetical protein n=1 Tax=unclassified Burkholderia TaxID=2613784 RepID=UPI0007564264|nr:MULTISPECIES: hypothetical protein [unclassified Burkholderia]KUY94467.1 hypothetical protein WS48_19740 [Burkholderia sp. RF7-non_BP1]KUZ02251.1 hypothetical protein WS49_14525 [Burkholderia sp. RF7-non_BP4]
MSCRDSGDASRQAGGCFPHATGGGIGDHDGPATGSPCRAARLDLITHALPLETLHGAADPMKKGESIRPIVLY